MKIDLSTIVVLAGLAINFIAMMTGGIATMFAAWRWISEIRERLAAVEADVKHLLSRDVHGDVHG